MCFNSSIDLVFHLTIAQQINIKTINMKLIKREEMNPSVSNLLGSFLNDDFLNWPNNSWDRAKSVSPAVNICETDDAFELELVSPGMKKEDFKIEMEDDLLTISAEVKQETEENKKNFTRKEFSRQSFRRSFRLTDDKIKQDAIKASYENGVLSIVLPKKEEAKPLPARTISIS